MSTDPAAAEREGLLALLDWYRASGIAMAIDERAHDRFAEGAPSSVATTPPATLLPTPRAPVPAPRPQPAKPAAPSPILTPDAAKVALSAREAAAAAANLDALRAALGAFEGCPLKATATNLVFADGNPQASIMFIGEAPGADEDASGFPFVGRAGQLLDRMIAAIGLDRQSAYIANVIPWRPPGNRTPTPLEVSACLPFTLRQIELVAPRWLVTLGAAATQTLSQSKDGIMRMRGRWIEIEVGSLRIPTLPMLHPAYLLRTPAQKRLAWQDLRRLREAMDKA